MVAVSVAVAVAVAVVVVVIVVVVVVIAVAVVVGVVGIVWPSLILKRLAKSESFYRFSALIQKFVVLI